LEKKIQSKKGIKEGGQKTARGRACFPPIDVGGKIVAVKREVGGNQPGQGKKGKAGGKSTWIVATVKNEADRGARRGRPKVKKRVAKQPETHTPARQTPQKITRKQKEKKKKNTGLGK